MSRRKSDKFYIYAPKRSGHFKGKRLLGLNYAFDGDRESVTLQDLLDFLKEKGVPPSSVVMPGTFVTYAKV